MKNLFLLPTNKPTRIFTVESEVRLAGYPTTIFKTGKNLYIVNNDTIIENDWYIDLSNGQIIKANEFYVHKNHGDLCKKIILTTDVILIKYGIQSIDDEFLEWFVKNPSCESVEIKWVKTPDGIFYHQDNVPYSCYKIIIPKEEQDYTALLKQVGTKQETLEEAAEKYSENWEETTGLDYENTVPSEVNKLDFINGAKWQAERMYSEEESIQKIIDYVDFQFNTKGELNLEIKKWFEQFKKK